VVQVRDMTPQQLLASEAQQDDAMIITEVDISHLVIEDDTPGDNFQSAKQQRLLVEPLYSSEWSAVPFLADSNIGIFYGLYQPPIVPDTFLSLRVQLASDWSQKQHRTYLVWQMGKVPEVCIEIVSNQEGSELALSRKAQREGKTQSKREIYAQMGVPYYVVFDPSRQIQGELEMRDALLRVWTLNGGRYVELTSESGIVEVGQPVWLEPVEIGLVLWEGTFEEDVTRVWLRWCDRDGQVIPTGAERAEQAEIQLEAERQRAETERQRAEAERQRAEQLAARLRALGINPEDG